MWVETLDHSARLLLSAGSDCSQDDPYFGEIAAWLDAAEAKDAGNTVTESAIADDDDSFTLAPDGILSTFRDACGTYALTWSVTPSSSSSAWW